MIFGTVGTDPRGFDRLVRGLDRWAAQNTEQVVIQIGGSSYEPKSAAWFRFTSRGEIDSFMRDARVVVTHAGVGSLLSAIDLGRPVVAVPRLASLGEVIDDHQVELCEALGQAGLARIITDVSELQRWLGPQSMPPAPSLEPRVLLITSVAAAVDALVRRH